jgi:hypothetical protein
MKLSRITAVVIAGAVLVGLLGSARAETVARPTRATGHIQSLFSLFADNPFTAARSPRGSTSG